MAINVAQPTARGLFVHLSGNLVTDRETSGDTWILRRLRDCLRVEVPIALFLDGSANVTPDMGRLATLVVGPHCWPPIDTPRRVWHALKQLVAAVEGRTRCFTSVRRVPMLIPLAWQRTDREPMRAFRSSLSRWESVPGIMAANCFAGFPYGDIPETGASVVVTTDGSTEQAEQAAGELADALWARRDEFIERGLNIEQAVHTAIEASTHAYVIADVGDAPEAGAPGDGTAALWALIDLGIRDAALASIADAAAVETAIRAGIGARVSLSVGGKFDRRHGYPIDVHGYVRNIAGGVFQRLSPIDAGLVTWAGPSVLIEVHGRHHGRFMLAITSQAVPADDPGLLIELGLQPDEPRVLVLKSAVNYVAAWDRPSVRTLPAETPGITTTDLAFFSYHRLRRPIWPLDPFSS